MSNKWGLIRALALVTIYSLSLWRTRSRIGVTRSCGPLLSHSLSLSLALVLSRSRSPDHSLPRGGGGVSLQQTSWRGSIFMEINSVRSAALSRFFSLLLLRAAAPISSRVSCFSSAFPLSLSPSFSYMYADTHLGAHIFALFYDSVPSYGAGRALLAVYPPNYAEFIS